MSFLRDVFAMGLGVFLGFAAILNTHELLDVIHAFVRLESLMMWSQI